MPVIMTEEHAASRKRRSSSSTSADTESKPEGSAITMGEGGTVVEANKNKRKGRPGRPRLPLDEGNSIPASSANLDNHATVVTSSVTPFSKDAAGYIRSTNSSSSNNSHNSLSFSRSVNEVIPKVWIISNFSVPIMAQIAVEALKKGDKVVLGCCPGGDNEPKLLRHADRLRQRCPDRCIVVELDVKNCALCQSTISKTITQFGRIDIVVNCTNRVYAGALEEVEEWHMRGQMDQTFYGAVNMIQAALPLMRKQYFGHFVNVTDITGNIGTPALSLLSGAMHALEGYLEALACEVAPFNIKVTIVESPMEVSLLTIPLVFADPLPQYGPDTPAGRLRSVLSSSNVFPEIAFKNTIHTVISVGGLENPPGRIVVGKDAITQIKDKLALLSEDLEEFSAVSISADYEDYSIF